MRGNLAGSCFCQSPGDPPGTDSQPFSYLQAIFLYRKYYSGVFRKLFSGADRYSPVGKTPVRYTTGARFSTSMISAIANQGQLRFMIYKGGLNIDIFLTFLKRLIKDAQKKVFLIVDNLRVHHAKLVQEWLNEHKNEIELFYLPAYTPERNPDEYLNQDVKTSIGNKRAPRDQKELSTNLLNYMKSLQKRKSKVMNFFNHKLVSYAA